MQVSFLNKIHSFFLSNTVWIYVVLMAIFSYLLNNTMVKPTWNNQLFYTVLLCILYAPLLLFSFFRTSLNQLLPNWALSLLWMFCFIGFPIFLFWCRASFLDNMFPLDNYQHGDEDIPAFHYSFFLTINTGVILTELAILYNEYLLGWLKSRKWFKQLNLDRMIFLLVIFLTAFFTIWTTIEQMKTSPTTGIYSFFKAVPIAFANTLQILFILLCYYSFYYVNRHYLIPQFLSKKGIVYYGFAAIGSIIIAYPLFVYLIRFLPIVDDFGVTLFADNTRLYAKDRGGIPIMIMLFSMPITVAMQWFEQKNKITSLEKENTTTELNLLKQQINPHFFFNTLNNLYALSIVKDKQTPEVILQLSELMRYVIYKGKENQVKLKEEVKYIEDYVQLQRIRLHKQLDFQFEKNILADDVNIPPLLFIPFVENAFKHGIEPAEKDCFLYLSLKSDSDSLTFICKNSLEEKNTTPSGIGLENLKKRMELSFPNAHQLAYQETEDTYIASLTVRLSQKAAV